MGIEAKIIADSVNVCGNRLTTFVCRYPRYLLAEVNTHRALSRNSASSRAIPVHKMLGLVISEPAEPVSWGRNCKGMQAFEELSPHKQWLAKSLWKLSSWTQVGFAYLMSKVGVHKQVANRLVEPFAHATTIITATEWGNFFNLRCHPDAQPEFQALADAMLSAYCLSRPILLQPGEWHLPFADKFLTNQLTIEEKLKVVTARCARVSYLNHEGKVDYAKDFDLHDRLIEDGHPSPTEHSGQALDEPRPSGNFLGYIQYRKFFANENRSAFDPHALLSKRKGRP